MIQPRTYPILPFRGCRRRTTSILGLVLALLVSAGCGGQTVTTNRGDSATPVVVATTNIWADVVSNLACGDVQVQTLLPNGADPHNFEPSLADRATLGGASLIVTNGLGLEAGLVDTIESVEQDGVPIFTMTQHIDIEGNDPHVWFDPIRVQAALQPLADDLVNHVGLDALAVERCATEYKAELAKLDAEIETLTIAVPETSRKLVSNHNSLGYFADRYGFEVIGTIIPSPSALAETSPAKLEELAVVVAKADVPAIFAEHHHSSDDAEALAKRIGDVEVITLHTESLGPPDSESDTYLGFLHSVAVLITEALA